MIQSKSIFASKTFWGAVLTLIAGALAASGKDIISDAEAQDAAEWVAMLVGFVLTVIGRAKADRPVTVKGGSPLFFLPFLSLLVLLGTVGCSGGGTIRVSALDPVLGPVMDRHDEYVAADERLLPEQRSLYLRSTSILRDALDAARSETE